MGTRVIIRKNIFLGATVKRLRRKGLVKVVFLLLLIEYNDQGSQMFQALKMVKGLEYLKLYFYCRKDCFFIEFNRIMIIIGLPEIFGCRRDNFILRFVY